MNEQLILVDPDDKPAGTCEKLRAHREGLLHRAFSIFLFDDAGRLLLQQRASAKYHSGGLWTNTCCGHPRPGEAMPDAVHRRLGEEMGVSCPLRPVGSLLYRASLDHGLTEHEVTHIHVGRYAGAPQPDPKEAADWRWVALPALAGWLHAEPQAFTVWFRHMIELAGMPTIQAWSQGQLGSAVRMKAI